MYKVNVQELKESVQIIVKEFQTWLQAVSKLTWKPEHGVMPLIRSAILRRQYDCLDSIVFLVESSRGYAAVPLLRAACEEVLWIKYLHSMKPEMAEELMTCLIKKELLDNLSAQEDYAGSSVMDELGLSVYLQGEKKAAAGIDARLKAVGKKLGWSERTLSQGTKPSTFFVAKQVGMLPMYNFLYHGTSRYVHFSGVELLRRTWGRSGDVSVASVHFSNYWAVFSLHWGISLFFDTYNELAKIFSEIESLPELDVEKILLATKRIGDFGQVPLITAEELFWKDE